MEHWLLWIGGGATALIFAVVMSTHKGYFDISWLTDILGDAVWELLFPF
jgi:hypothetical protein